MQWLESLDLSDNKFLKLNFADIIKLKSLKKLNISNISKVYRLDDSNSPGVEQSKVSSENMKKEIADFKKRVEIIK